MGTLGASQPAAETLLWASVGSTLSLSFPLYKMGEITIPTQGSES